MAANGKAPIRNCNSTAIPRPIPFPLAAIPGTNTNIDSWGGDPSLVTHRGIFCKGPQCSEKTEPIRGIRYKCSQCPNVDFDETCMRHPTNSHNRSHTFWPCYGECVFEDNRNMSSEEIQELKEFAGDMPEEYLVAPPNNLANGLVNNAGCEDRADAVYLEGLGRQLFGIDKQTSDDQLLVHWKSGIPAVRLINLLPGSPNDNLHCYFTSTRLDTPELYDVLCSDWTPEDVISRVVSEDETDFPAMVFIGDQMAPVPVTKVTADALRSLRSSDDVVKLWVRELCVLQQESEFKAFQERSTSLVYSRAVRTVVWAGHENENTEAAWMLIEILSHRCQREDGTFFTPSDLKQDSELKELELLPIGSEKWQSLVEFFPLHLFTQGWLLHDVAFAQKAYVKCGDYELEWWQVARVRDMLAQPSWTQWLGKFFKKLL